MTIADLKLMIKDCPDDMKVLLPGAEVFDGFLKDPCSAESGVIQVPDIPEDKMEEVMELDPKDIDEKLYPYKEIFLLAHHGFSGVEHKEGVVDPALN